MTYAEVRPFFEQNHRGVIFTVRRNGAPQVSVVASGVMDGNPVFVCRGDSAKLANVRRNPTYVVMATASNWSSYAVVEGASEVHGWHNKGPETLRVLLRDAFRACGGITQTGRSAAPWCWCARTTSTVCFDNLQI